MNHTPWLLLDTETTGFKPPIFVVELAAQRMRGWEPEGLPFRRLLNHGVAIPPEAARVNGYTKEILERDGDQPRKVYAAFIAYVGERPLVSYNLRYDLDEVLLPEWQWLGIPPISHSGFCVLRLTQRLLDPVPAGNHKLQTLRQYYRLPERGAHTAVGDVNTVVDLLGQVLRPLAEARGLTTWADLCAFAATPWFPSRIAFGKYQGRAYQEARSDPDLYAWLEWLARSSNPRSAEMGRWYLDQLLISASEPPLVVVAEGAEGGLLLFRHPELELLRQLIANARARLADLEADYTQARHGVALVQAQLFTRLRPYYERRDALKLTIQYRRRYLDTLLIEGEENAETVTRDHDQARAETEWDYAKATAEAADRQALSAEDEKALKAIYRKLVGLYHPDRYAQEPDKQAIYARLMQEINQARDRGDIARLREIANDPNGFLLRQGLSGLDLSDDAELAKLRSLYAALQARILSTLEELDRLRASGDYELYQLSQESPVVLATLADQQAAELTPEITVLEAEAARLKAEIESLTGADPFDQGKADR
ncbi:MAG: exonuclease [Gammaproteobacteria bacterium]|nr:exonuclease [Gammaproteobacteria bacterium]